MNKQSDKWLDDMTDESPAAKHVAWAGELVFAGAREDDRIGRTAKFDIIRLPEDAGKVNPFAEHTRRRANHAGTRFTLALSMLEPVCEATDWLDEVMLLGWNDGPKGQMVTLLLQPTADKHPFMTTDRGTRYMAVFVELDDADAAVDQHKRERVEKAPQRLSNVAAQMIKTVAYQQFSKTGSKEFADEFMKIELGIGSKSELDSDANAVKRFRAHCDEFVLWQKKNGYLL